MRAASGPLRAMLGLAAAIAFAMLAPASATAADAAGQPERSSAGGCPPAALSHPFLAWGDDAAYWLAPGGSFEDGAAGWELAGGAELVAAGAPFVGSSAATALRLPPGAMATSELACFEPADRSWRMFARSAGDGVGPTLLGFRLLSATGEVEHSGFLTAGDEWDATRRLLTAPPSDPAERWMRFELTAHGGEWSVDDVYVDPRARH